MRTARSVMVCALLFFVPLSGPGQGTSSAASVDTTITVVGRDESAIPLLPPWRQSGLTVPDLVIWQPPLFLVPAIAPSPLEPSPSFPPRAFPLGDVGQ
jgi:hypothetical protein